jgi:superfamily II DNA/RNA helicase
MLDMGFIPDVERIVSMLPPIRQTLFFSATMAPEIRRLADKFLMNPKEVSVAPPASPAETVAQHLVRCSIKDKRDVLRALLERETVDSALIFCNRKRDISVLHRSLTRHGFDAVQLHGDMSQPARTETLARFKNGEARMVVCSDVAARGLDIKGLSHVFNFDVPSHSEDYVHRIGRTGRAGLSGRAFMLATPEDSKLLAGVERLIGKKIPVIELDGSFAGDAAAAEPAAEEKSGSRRRRGAGPRAEAAQPTVPVEPKAPVEAIAETEPKPARRRRRGGRSDAATDPVANNAALAAPAMVEPAPIEAAAAPIAAREPSITGGGVVEAFPPRDNGARRGRGGRGGRDGDDDRQPSRVTGFGDEVPAFLLRPVPTKATG